MSDFILRNKRQREGWNKKFREKRDQGQQWRIKQNKTWKFKLQRRRRTKRKMLQNYIRNESNHYINDVDPNPEQQYGFDKFTYMYYADILPVDNESFAMRFDECYSYWSRYVTYYRWSYREELSDQHKLTYDKYLYYFPFYLQFSYKMYKYKPIFTKALTELFNNQHVAIKFDKHAFWAKIMFALFEKREHSSMNCGHCKQCKDRLAISNNLYDSLLTLAIRDLEPLILEIIQNIQYKQQKKIDIINEFNANNNKNSCCQYLMNVVNTYGVSCDICDIILNFVSDEYPIIINDDMEEYKVYNKYYFRSKFIGRFCLIWGRRIEMKWIHCKSVEFIRENYYYLYNDQQILRLFKTFTKDNDFPNLLKPKNIHIFHESCQCCIGYTDYKNENVYFYYGDDSFNAHRKIMFAKCWLDLWNMIEIDSIKIDCYSFLFQQ